MSTINLTSANFNQVVNHENKTVLIDFWAPWCMPCRVLGPVMEEISIEQSNLVTIAKVNVDENPELAAQFGIQGIPTVKIFKAGSEVFSTSGAHPKQYWESVIKKVQ